MTVLKTIPNGASNKDIRQTINALLAPNNANIVVVGDSIPASYLADHGWPPALGCPAPAVVNSTYCTSGHTLADVPGDLPAEGFFPLYQIGKTNIAVIQRCTNDLGNIGATDAQAYASLTTAIQMAQVAGFYTVVMTVLPRADAGWNATKEGYRTSYNTKVLANAAGADAVIDIASDPVLGASSAPNNRLLSVDKLHPTTAGQDRIASVVRAGLVAATGLTPKAPTSRALTLSVNSTTANSSWGAVVGRNRQDGSTITATSSDGTAITATGSATGWTLAGKFTAVGTPTVSVVETPFDGSAAKTTGITVQVTAGGGGGTQAVDPLTLNSPTFGAAKFAQGLTSGTAYLPATIEPAAPYTVECYAKWTDPGLNVIIGTEGGWYLATYNDGLYGSSVNGSGAMGSGLNDGNFHHLRAALKTDSIDVYVDGSLVGNIPGAPISSGRIAHRVGNGGNYVFGGVTDQLAVFSGVRTTAPGQLSGAETGLLALYKLDGDGTGVRPA